MEAGNSQETYINIFCYPLPLRLGNGCWYTRNPINFEDSDIKSLPVNVSTKVTNTKVYVRVNLKQ